MYKGFINAPDSNNCFINTVLQALFHQPLFRESIRETKIVHPPQHLTVEDTCSCILCSLKQIEQDLRNPSPSLSSDSIRIALLSMRHVQVNEMGDAIEAFEDIAQLLHANASISMFNESQSKLLNLYDHEDCKEHCIAHSLFGIVHTISSTCPICSTHRERSESLWHQPLIVTQLLEENVSGEIMSLIHKQLEINCEYITCDECSRMGITTKVKTSDHIKRYPPLLAVSCIFPTSNPSFDTMMQFFHLLTSPMLSTYSLHALVCYRAYHYVSICLEGSIEAENTFWVEYNDSNRRVFLSTDAMIAHCLDTQSLPVLLFFSTNRCDSFDVHLSGDNFDEQLVENEKACCAKEDLFLSFASSIANTVKNLFRPSSVDSQGNTIPMVCPFCYHSFNIHSDELVCPNCHQPLP